MRSARFSRVRVTACFMRSRKAGFLFFFEAAEQSLNHGKAEAMIIAVQIGVDVSGAAAELLDARSFQRSCGGIRVGGRRVWRVCGVELRWRPPLQLPLRVAV